MDVTSPSSAEGPGATPQRSAPPSSARRSSASRRSPSSAAPACASGASRRRRGCRPRTSCTRRRDSFAKLGVTRRRAAARLRRRERVEGGGRQADDRRRRLRSSRRTASSGSRAPARSRTRTRSRVEGGEDVTFKSAIVATGSFPMRPPIPGLESRPLRRLDRPARADRGAAAGSSSSAAGSSAASSRRSSARFGSEVTIIEMLDRLIPQEDEDAAKELAKAVRQEGDRAPARQAVHRRSSSTATR